MVTLLFIAVLFEDDSELPQHRFAFPTDAAAIAGLPGARDSPPPAVSALEIGLILAEAVLEPGDSSLPVLYRTLGVALIQYPAPRLTVIALWLQRLGLPAAARARIRKALAKGTYRKVPLDTQPRSEDAAASPARTCSNPACPSSSEELREARFFVCAGCRRAIYCGKECQASHWKVHKRLCRKWAAAREGAGAGDRMKEGAG